MEIWPSGLARTQMMSERETPSMSAESVIQQERTRTSTE